MLQNFNLKYILILFYTHYISSINSNQIFNIKNNKQEDNYIIEYKISPPQYIIKDSIQIINEDNLEKLKFIIKANDEGSILSPKTKTNYSVLYGNGEINIPLPNIENGIIIEYNLLNSAHNVISEEKNYIDTSDLKIKKEAALNENKKELKNHDKKKSQNNLLSKLLSKLDNKNYILMAFIIFCLGFLMSLTPCIYPMIPITISILGIDKQTLKSRLYSGFLYMSGMSTVFSILGILTASGKIVFGSLFQNNIFIILSTVVLIIMTLNMLDLLNFNIYFNSTFEMPNIIKNSRYLPFFYGMFSGTLSSPCVSPGLVAILSLVSQQNNLFIAWLWLFLFGCGLSLPLLLISLVMNANFIFPQSGSWMNDLKEIIGIILCFIISNNMLFLLGYKIAYLFTTIIIIYFIIVKIKNSNQKWYISKSVLFAIFSLFFIAYSLHEQYNFNRINKKEIKWEYNLEEAREKAIKKKKLLFLDITADWCSICKIVDKELFHNINFIENIAEHCILCKIDCTHENVKNKTIVKQYNIKGYPALLLIDPQTEYIKKIYNGDILEISHDDIINQIVNIKKEINL